MKPNSILGLATATAAALALGSLGACSKVGTHSDASHMSMAASPSAQLIGTTPAAPPPEPPGVTPVTGESSSMSKAQQAQGGPKEGDDSSHFTNAPGRKSPVGKDTAS